MQNPHARQTEPSSSTSVLSDGCFFFFSLVVLRASLGMFAEHSSGKHFFFLCDRAEKALVVCAVFLSPFVLGTKKLPFFFFLGVGREEGRGNEDCKHVCRLSMDSGISQFVLLLK